MRSESKACVLKKGPLCWSRLYCEPHSLMTDYALCLETLAVIVPRSHSVNPGRSWDDFQQISLPRSEARSELRDGWLTYWPWQVPRRIEECTWKFWNFQRASRWLRFQPHVRMMLCSEPVCLTACNVCLHDSITNKPHHISPVSSSFANSNSSVSVSFCQTCWRITGSALTGSSYLGNACGAQNERCVHSSAQK